VCMVYVCVAYACDCVCVLVCGPCLLCGRTCSCCPFLGIAVEFRAAVAAAALRLCVVGLGGGIWGGSGRGLFAALVLAALVFVLAIGIVVAATLVDLVALLALLLFTSCACYRPFVCMALALLAGGKLRRLCVAE
jgi:hypothetical protein